MRALLVLVAALLCAPARADLFTAQLAYQKADYERAFKDYRELAELGQPVAQYNLAIMYAKGQGVRQSELNAYAWATLAVEGDYGPARALAEKLRPELAPGSDKIAEDIRAPYARAALEARIMPQMQADKGGRDRCKWLKLSMPAYPSEANRQGIQGQVYIEFAVMPDGSGRNPRILYALPRDIFERAVRVSILHTSYEPAEAGAKAAHCEVMYRFVAQQQRADEYPGLERLVADTLKKAETGDTQAELLYGMLLAGLPQLQRKPVDALPWFLKAAQSGSREAQYEIGNGLLNGWGCRCDENKGLEWLRRAAAADQPSAQVTLATYALRGTPGAANVKVAKLWLERAAARRDPDGMLYLSALLAATPESEMRDPPRAQKLVEHIVRQMDDDPTPFEIRAAAQAASGAFQDAVSSERRAIAMATKLKWDLAPLDERLAHYESRQPWYGDLLGL